MCDEMYIGDWSAEVLLALVKKRDEEIRGLRNEKQRCCQPIKDKLKAENKRLTEELERWQQSGQHAGCRINEHRAQETIQRLREVLEFLAKHDCVSWECNHPQRPWPEKCAPQIARDALKGPTP